MQNWLDILSFCFLIFRAVMQSFIFIGLYAALLLCFQVGEELDDVGGHRGRSWQVFTGSLEPVFIGDPVYGEGDTFRRDVRVKSAGNGADIFGIRSNLFLNSFSFYLDSVFARKAAPQ